MLTFVFPLLLLWITGCRGNTPGEPAADLNPFDTPDPPSTLNGPAWEATSEAFSPTLPHLFDQGRIFVMPAAATGMPVAELPPAEYAFSAVDRYGKLYHFNRSGQWWMSPGANLPAELPPGEWDVAWSSATSSPELVVSAPWLGRREITLLHWEPAGWTGATTETTPTLVNPPARHGARRLHLPAREAWLIAGGQVAAESSATLSQASRTTQASILRPAVDRVDAWWFESGRWIPWPGLEVEGPRGAAPPAVAPEPTSITALLSATTDSTVNVLLKTGDLWAWQLGAWHWRERLPSPERILIAHGLLSSRQLLLVWNFGRGYDQVALRPAQWSPGYTPTPPDALNQTANVKINEEDEGVWRGWGRILDVTQADGSSREQFSAGFTTPGEDAISIQGETGDVYFRRAQLRIIELPPELTDLRPEAAAWVPALDGLLVPSAGGAGLAADQSTFFPDARGTDTQTTDPRQLIDVLQRSYRFWNFRGDLIDWTKAPADIYAQIGYPDVYFHGADSRRTLSWTFPEPGLFRFEYRESTPGNEQWVRSPLLTMRTLPQLAWNPTDELVICDPVVLGDPAEIVLVGWCGRLARPRDRKKLEAELEGEVYTEVPTRGFMARISALDPRDWRVSDLPIAFSRGARLVVDHSIGRLYLVGGRTAAPRVVENRPYLVLSSNNIVWEWDGTQWRYIKPLGTVPQMKVVSNVAFDPLAHLLLSLTPRALYAYQNDTWRELWRRPKPEGEDWPDQLGLYVHPVDNLKLGIWFKVQSEMHVWTGSTWEPVLRAGTRDQLVWPYDYQGAGGGAWPNLADNLLPALLANQFVSIDGRKLAELRMDVPRNREEDRLLRAHWITLKKNENLRLTTPAPGLLGLHKD